MGKMMISIKKLLLIINLFLCVGFFQLSPNISHASDSLCAEVKIEISQELTLERQAFDAHMRINNGLTHITLENVKAEIIFTDDNENIVTATNDPDDTTAVFYIREDSEGLTLNPDATWAITDVAPSSSSDLHWLIIPSPGASDGLPQGKLYYVGAKLTYSIGGEENVTVVTPDYIYVKPMPQIALDYFLPEQVFSDNPFTPAEEPPVPFQLAVRVKNFGSGTAKSLKIDSAQPKIVENKQGLLIGFNIEGSEIDGQPKTSSLLIDFGDIQSETAKMARWIMTTSLSGQFTYFSADISHSDELGGELTSLIKNEDINTHTFIKDVVVDLPGSDTIVDYLAKDDDIYRVYVSDGEDTDVAFQTDIQFSELGQISEDRYTLSSSASGLIYARVKLESPYNNDSTVIKEVMRSDGKTIKSGNTWISKYQPDNTVETYEYYLNIFDVDVNSADTFTIVFEDASSSSIPQPPVFGSISDQTAVEGDRVAITVSATDLNNTIPVLSAESVPPGAEPFNDNKNGTGTFVWDTSVGQAGTYVVLFNASDGVLQDTEDVVIRICPVSDTDCDGMPDVWELEHFGNLDRDGTLDLDGDGIPDLEEYLNDLDPDSSDDVLDTPEILSPSDNTEVNTLTPELTVNNITASDGISLSYSFEIYSDPEMTDLVAGNQDVPETTDTTTWIVSGDLSDNTGYYWRVRATNGASAGLWAYGSFFVNTANDPPGSFNISSPSDGSYVDTRSPLFEVGNVSDVDEDHITYTFEVYADSEMIMQVTSGTGIWESEYKMTSWRIGMTLDDGATYFWKVVATDPHGLYSETPLATFHVNTADPSPDTPVISSPVSNAETDTLEVDLVVENAQANDDDTLTYYFELDSSNTFDNPVRQISGEIAEGAETTAWHVSGMADNTRYYWRVKASDGNSESRWGYGTFFVNTENDAPETPALKNPGINAWTDTLTPSFSVLPAKDKDNDQLIYRYEIYSDSSSTTLVTDGESENTCWVTPIELEDNTLYFWRAQAEDEHGIGSEWTDLSAFFVKDNKVNDSPEITMIVPSDDIKTNKNSINLHWEDKDPDNNADISIYYDTDNTGMDGLLIVSGLDENPEIAGDTYDWDITTLTGTYYVYAITDDGEFSSTSYSTGSITIDRTQPVVTAGPAGATYNNSVDVTLTADESAVIYYTLDGTDPGPYAALYTFPIEIIENSTLKFMATDIAGNTSDIVTEEYIIEEDSDISVTVTVGGTKTFSGMTVYAYTESGTYTNLSAVTDEDGTATFTPDDFAAGSYKFRVAYLGYQFWSGPVLLPDVSDIDIAIDEEAVELTVSTAGGIAQYIRVYLFTEAGTYQNIFLETDENGKVVFYLPIGMSYKFRADILGSQYYSEPITVAGEGVNITSLDTGGGLFRITVREDTTTPMENIRAYLFKDTGSYLNLNQTTDTDGMVAFNVPEGMYKVRADYLGYQFWSSPDTFVNADADIVLEIPHQDIRVNVNGDFQSTLDPVTDIPVYLFTESSAYLNQNRITDENGQVIFHLPNMSYKVRADYRNHQFWSENIQWTDSEISIPMADAEVSVGWGASLLEGVPVYAFTEIGAYLNMTGATDNSGNVVFRLPASTYKFRADYQTSQYWSSDVSLSADLVNPVDISTGGGTFEFTVLKGQEEPIVGVNSHVFSQSGAYFGVHGPTSSEGLVTFDLADGQYNIRVDYLGYQFWTDNFYDVPDVLSDTFTIPHQSIDITVNSQFQGTTQPLENVNVYLFTPTGSYMNWNELTDAGGHAGFSLPEESYKVRVDYLGRQYWSEEFNSEDKTINIPMSDAAITVTGNGQLLVNVPVNVFTLSGSYLNINGITDADGQVIFRLPAGAYKFRADYQNSQYWSGDTQLIADVSNPVAISTGGGTFTFTVRKNDTESLAGVKCYLFTSSNTYLNMNETTSSEGQVSFALADGAYRVRVDYMGYQFWSETFEIPITLSDVFTIPHQDVTLTVNKAYLATSEPLENVSACLFTASGAYLNINRQTDINGQVVFNLPQKTYNVRAEYLNQQFWSGDFIWEGKNIDIPMADAEISVTGAGSVLESIPVYVFTGTGAYLNMNNTTDASGEVVFRLPAGSYKFRANYQTGQYWTEDPVIVVADQVNSVNIDTGGGLFTLTVLKGAGLPLSGVNCYVFNTSNAYLGMSGVTDVSGQISFGLADGSYRFRVNHLGYQFWTIDYTITDILSDNFTIAHQDITITVEEFYQAAAPIEDVRVYLFTQSGSYLNQNLNTDANGQVIFNLPDESYKVRADYLGSQFWSDTFQAQNATVTIGHGMANVHVSRSGADVENSIVYLYTGSGSYLNWNEDTDASGNASFLLPVGSYKYRADEGGVQVYSGVIEITSGTDSSVEISLD